MARQTTLAGSSLPYLRVERFPGGSARGFEPPQGLYEYQCIRRGCGKFFYVLEPLPPEHTAPCPHCFQVSRVPAS